MKKFRLVFQLGKTLFFFVILASIGVTQGCNDDDDDIDPLQTRLAELTGTWQLGSVLNDANDVSDQFQGFMLTLNADKTFFTTNGGNAWPATGSFDFVDDNINQILRSDDIAITIADVTTNSLQLTFMQNAITGRTQGITGSFSFSLIK